MKRRSRHCMQPNATHVRHQDPSSVLQDCGSEASGQAFTSWLQRLSRGCSGCQRGHIRQFQSADASLYSLGVELSLTKPATAQREARGGRGMLQTSMAC